MPRFIRYSLHSRVGLRVVSSYIWIIGAHGYHMYLPALVTVEMLRMDHLKLVNYVVTLDRKTVMGKGERERGGGEEERKG